MTAYPPAPSTVPMPLARQLLEERGRFRLAGTGKVIGTYEAGTLRKRIDPDRHTYRRRPGVALNLELIATLDRVRPTPRDVLLEHADPSHPRRFRIPWARVVAYAALAAAGDDRYLIDDDVDRQVLLPWAAITGEELAPPPRPKAPPRRAPAEAPPTLF